MKLSISITTMLIWVIVFGASAHAINPADFQPGRIIDDEVFYNKNAWAALRLFRILLVTIHQKRVTPGGLSRLDLAILLMHNMRNRWGGRGRRMYVYRTITRTRVQGKHLSKKAVDISMAELVQAKLFGMNLRPMELIRKCFWLH
jgi:hypothetical protein